MTMAESRSASSGWATLKSHLASLGLDFFSSTSLRVKSYLFFFFFFFQGRLLSDIPRAGSNTSQSCKHQLQRLFDN